MVIGILFCFCSFSLKVTFIFGSHTYAAVAVLRVPPSTQRANRLNCLKNCPALFKITIQWFWLAFKQKRSKLCRRR